MSPQLCFDIQVEIIKRLPVKSLIQFRSVCKRWKSLIDSSRFIARYDYRHDQSEHLLLRYEFGVFGHVQQTGHVCYVDDDSFPRKRFAPPVPPILPKLGECRLNGSSCGLICFDGVLREPDNSKTHIVVLWNPSIRKSIAIVAPNVVHPSSRFYPSVVGFGVCPETKDPKIVKFSYDEDDNPCQVMVFTLSSGEWRFLRSNQLPRKSFGYNSLNAIGRFIYRLAFDGGFYLLLSFDLTTNEFGEVHLPDGLRQTYSAILNLRESLVLVNSNINATDFDVWRMEDGDPKAFTKLFTINKIGKPIVDILGFKKTGEAIVQIEKDLDSGPTTLLAVYEPCLRRIKGLVVRLVFRGTDVTFFMCSYTESLFLLDHDDGRIVSCGAVKS